ncbi:hypothetical protein GYMLUDRAFT_249603 [Collybiopsis luxurians FD-317 M1]|uniref:Uncharacterized protein n=1 Tax=Collybiopsis luxurians FD-317 M1 TaxID=944289 RepID=A0A0D0C8I8_9AGAR|nr:hypothetical protein GYMLUDRAFT_249603 [Collybiopsis luxurians FD-317 M1]
MPNLQINDSEDNQEQTVLHPEHFIQALTMVLFHNPLQDRIWTASERETEVLEGLKKLKGLQKLTGGLAEWKEEEEETAQFEDVDSHVLHKAWEHLQEWNGLTVDGKLQQKDGVDVNFEALHLLDKIMFDESQRAGVAGNHQWGLDVGPHEGGGDPQLIGPDVTPYDMKGDGNDDEEVVYGPDYNYESFHQDLKRKRKISNGDGMGNAKKPKTKKNSGQQN